MLVLGIETSCDDTASAVVEDGRVVRSSVVSSQDEIHGRYGGVVPELASRRHIEMIVPVVTAALERAGASMADIGGIAVTQGPGLVGSILVGLSFAKVAGYVSGLPLTGVNHIAAHPLAAFLHEPGEDEDAPPFPHVALVVSGGHTTLMLMEGPALYRVLGQTLDDAAGEAFDKTAKLLGLGYPGGVAIDILSREGDRTSVDFTRPYMARGNLDFSFSGLKTAVLNHVRGLGAAVGSGGSTDAPPEVIRDVAASFQEAVVDVLVKKALWALEATGTEDLVIAGGVACNSRLRERLRCAAGDEGFRVYIPPGRYCSDNGAIVAALGFHQLRAGLTAPLDMNARPTWEGF